MKMNSFAYYTHIFKKALADISSELCLREASEKIINDA